MRQKAMGLALAMGAMLIDASSLHGQSTQAVLQSAAAAFSQGNPVSSVTLNATATWTAGSDNESGSAVLTAGADGSYSVQLSLSNSARAEAQTSFASGQSCTWAGTDGVPQPVAGQNCMSSVAWFLPSVAIFGGQQLGTVTTALVSSGGSASLLDLEQQQTPPSTVNPTMAAQLLHFSTVDLFLDPGSYLPTELDYNLHPDTNAGVDIPVQVLYSNYQAVGGVSVPYRIQRYVNGTLQLDLAVSSEKTS